MCNLGTVLYFLSIFSSFFVQSLTYFNFYPYHFSGTKSKSTCYEKLDNMAEWSLNKVAPTASPTTPSQSNNWNVNHSASTTQKPDQQWEITAQQWNLGQPEPESFAPHKEESVPALQAEIEQWNVVEQQKTGTPPPQQRNNEKKPLPQKVLTEQSTFPKVNVGDQERTVTPIDFETTTEVTTQIDAAPSSTCATTGNTETERIVVKSRDSNPAAPPVAPKPTLPQLPPDVVIEHASGVSTGAQPAASQAALKVKAHVTMQPVVTHQDVTQVSHAQAVERGTYQRQTEPARKLQQEAAYEKSAPAVKPKLQDDNQDILKREGGVDFPLEEKQKGVFWLGPDLEGWLDKTKALKEEFRRQSDANEMYFAKNQPKLDLRGLNISEDPSKFIYNVLDLKGIEIVNLIRSILNEYHHSETGPFFFQFGEDKKFKLELLPTATQPGNGLIKSVGRRKYYAYPDICAMLKSAGVTSKGLGIMLQKLNTSGLKPAMHNQISPMNELHFMLLYEISRRLVRGPHGFSLSTEPEFDQLPIGPAVARMITLFCKGNYCLNYEAVFGVQDKFNPFIDTSVVLRRQKIYALNKLFYDAEIRSQASDNPYISKFLKYHNGYIIKTTTGFMEELDMAFRGF